MRAIIFSAIFLIGLAPCVGKATPFSPNPTPIVLASENAPDMYRRSAIIGNASLLTAPRVHYVSHASGLDRIDPASMRVFGGQIGGNGVKGGAVISLSWPTDR